MLSSGHEVLTVEVKVPVELIELHTFTYVKVEQTGDVLIVTPVTLYGGR